MSEESEQLLYEERIAFLDALKKELIIGDAITALELVVAETSRLETNRFFVNAKKDRETIDDHLALNEFFYSDTVGRGAGKTTKIIQKARLENLTVICTSNSRARGLANEHKDVHFVSVDNALDIFFDKKKYCIIDEVKENDFISLTTTGIKILGGVMQRE